MNVINKVKSIDYDLVKRCTEYIKDNYDFKKYLEDNNLFQGAVVQGSNWLITCPFHYDAYPSLSVDLEGHRFKCFSCNLHGNMLSFMLEYNIGVLGNNYSFYEFLDLLLRKDSKMQVALNASSIFVVGYKNFKEIEYKRKQVKLNLDRGYPESFTAMANKLIKQKAEDRIVIKMISLMQAGFTVEETWDELMNPQVESLGAFNIEELLSS